METGVPSGHKVEDPYALVGMKLKRKRPEDGVWTDAVVSDFLPDKKKHVVLYG